MDTIERRIISAIEAVSIWVGKVASWLIIILMLVISYEVVMRYVFSAPTIWGYEFAMMVGGSLVLMLAYTHQKNSHIRVEIFYEKMKPRGKALVNVIGALVFGFPACVYFLTASYQKFVNSITMHETMAGSFWYPPATPFRTIIFLGVILITLQLIASFLRDIHLIVKGESL